MKRRYLLVAAAAASIFFVGALSNVAQAQQTCSGSDTVCDGTCVITCDQNNPNHCYVTCQLQART